MREVALGPSPATKGLPAYRAASGSAGDGAVEEGGDVAAGAPAGKVGHARDASDEGLLGIDIDLLQTTSRQAAGEVRHMPTRKSTAPAAPEGPDAPGAERAVQATRDRAKRKKIAPAGLEAQGRVEETPKARFEYNPHLPPLLRFADEPAAADRPPQLLASLARREDLADKVQMIYIDPPNLTCLMSGVQQAPAHRNTGDSELDRYVQLSQGSRTSPREMAWAAE